MIQACNERQVNNYLYKTYEVPKPTIVSNRQADKPTNVSSSLPPIPQDEYVEMQSHCVQLQNRNWRRYDFLLSGRFSHGCMEPL